MFAVTSQRPATSVQVPSVVAPSRTVMSPAGIEQSIFLWNPNPIPLFAAVAVARDNARINREAPFIRAVTADGLVHPAIRTHAPFELIVANILAGPLTYLAPSLSAALAPGGVTVDPAGPAVSDDPRKLLLMITSEMKIGSAKFVLAKIKNASDPVTDKDTP